MNKCRHRLPHMLSNYLTISLPQPPSPHVLQHQETDQTDDQDHQPPSPVQHLQTPRTPKLMKDKATTPHSCLYRMKRREEVELLEKLSTTPTEMMSI